MMRYILTLILSLWLGIACAGMNSNPGENIVFSSSNASNYLKINASNGQVNWNGTYLKKLTLRPILTQTTAKAGGTPTQVKRGLNVGYSLPIWNSDDEELYWRMRIPIRWDNLTDPQFGVCVSLQKAEDVGDNFKFQLEWQTTGKGAGVVVGETTSTNVSQQSVLTDRSAANSTYFIFFTFDANDANNPLIPGNMLQARLRRVDAADPDITNEVIVWDWATMWAVDKVFGNWSVETNDA